MKRSWKTLIPLLLCGGLVACANTNQQPVEPESKPQVTPPKVEQPVVPAEPKPDIKPEVTPEPEVKPAEKPKPPVVKAKKTSDGRLILGEKEWVYLPGLEQSFKARIDTGATTSSISAIDIVPFERDGNDWVKFKIEHDGVKSKEIALPVERWVKIRQSSADGTQRRAVVQAWIEIGDMKEKTEFTLADRTHLTFPVLLGRSFFKDVALVDVSKQYIQDKHK
ncbi:RimK/LysX family protein [Vibrio renipiscarius]|uniref:ATP-dependent Zn protease n=1 Tax=Vibrio renipiscarius TaxID=1461322 RepID=A0A0C2NHV1_9VIBR|nr:ATP-dependent zinc protease [Vibrio renipiscarius]KII75935.1 ATP-dependent Zn protease [Vibrio renipiscarius]KII79039.1 ATP-dependent Zn protease [Vibrio renipiscarius]